MCILCILTTQNSTHTYTGMYKTSINMISYLWINVRIQYDRLLRLVLMFNCHFFLFMKALKCWFWVETFTQQSIGNKIIVLKCIAVFKLTNEWIKVVYRNICHYTEVVKGSMGRILLVPGKTNIAQEKAVMKEY